MTTRSRILLLLTLLLLLTACAPATEANDFAYADTAFTATVRGTYTPSDGIPRPIEAKVTIEAPVQSAAQREMSITFATPAVLNGVTVSTRQEPDEAGRPRRVIAFSAPSAYGTVTAATPDSTLKGFLRFAEALLPQGDIVSVSPQEANGTRTVARRTADGTWEGVYTFAEGHSLPLRVTITTAGERLEIAVEP